MKYYVENVPQSCEFCDCCHTKDYDSRHKIDGEKSCGIKNMEVSRYYDAEEKPDWCPLEEVTTVVSDNKVKKFAEEIKAKAVWLETYSRAFGHMADNLIDCVNGIIKEMG